MKFTGTTLFLLIFPIFISCSSSRHIWREDTLPASSLQAVGRYALTNQQLELITSGAHVGFIFRGKECSVFAGIPGASGHNYLQYEIDGKYQKRVKIEANSTEPFVINAVGAGTHTVWIFKATEAQTGPIYIKKITGKRLQALKITGSTLIEFIGNSITCGAASDASEVPCGTGKYHDQHNAYYAYGPRVARALGVDFVVSGISGTGIYRNWNSDGPTMPQVYEKTDLENFSQRFWNFSTFRPAIISIALGTNDLSKGDGKKERLPFDSAVFVSNYIKFVQLIKLKYPDAQIALPSSPMINGAQRIILQNCLTAIKATTDAFHTADRPVALFFFKPMQARGCSGHPSLEDHALLADELAPFFKKLLQ